MSSNSQPEIVEFGKYQALGSYHWRLTYSGKKLSASPRNHALYDASLDILTRWSGRSVESLFGSDVGCGDGVLLYKAHLRKGKIIGIDYSVKGLELAADEIFKRTSNRPQVLSGSCYELPLISASLDYVISTELIEHLDNDELFLQEVARVLRPGGIFVCTTPWRRQNSVFHDPYHVREYTPQELRQVIAKSLDRATVVGLYPAWLDRLYLWNKPHVLGRGVRALFKTLALYYNPYQKILVSNPTDATRCANLIGIGRKIGMLGR